MNFVLLGSFCPYFRMKIENSNNFINKFKQFLNQP